MKRRNKVVSLFALGSLVLVSCTETEQVPLGLDEPVQEEQTIIEEGATPPALQTVWGLGCLRNMENTPNGHLICAKIYAVIQLLSLVSGQHSAECKAIGDHLAWLYNSNDATVGIFPIPETATGGAAQYVENIGAGIERLEFIPEAWSLGGAEYEHLVPHEGSHSSRTRNSDDYYGGPVPPNDSGQWWGLTCRELINNIPNGRIARMLDVSRRQG